MFKKARPPQAYSDLDGGAEWNLVGGTLADTEAGPSQRKVPWYTWPLLVCAVSRSRRLVDGCLLFG